MRQLVDRPEPHAPWRRRRPGSGRRAADPRARAARRPSAARPSPGSPRAGPPSTSGRPRRSPAPASTPPTAPPRRRRTAAPTPATSTRRSSRSRTTASSRPGAAPSRPPTAGSATTRSSSSSRTADARQRGSTAAASSLNSTTARSSTAHASARSVARRDTSARPSRYDWLARPDQSAGEAAASSSRHSSAAPDACRSRSAADLAACTSTTGIGRPVDVVVTAPPDRPRPGSPRPRAPGARRSPSNRRALPAQRSERLAGVRHVPAHLDRAPGVEAVGGTEQLVARPRGGVAGQTGVPGSRLQRRRIDGVAHERHPTASNDRQQRCPQLWIERDWRAMLCACPRAP